MEKIVKFKDTMLTFNHYKEPLAEIPKIEGYGYYGAVLGSLDGNGIQCHLCGVQRNIFCKRNGKY